MKKIKHKKIGWVIIVLLAFLFYSCNGNKGITTLQLSGVNKYYQINENGVTCNNLEKK